MLSVTLRSRACFLAALLTVCILALPVRTGAQELGSREFPMPDGLVSDFAGVLTEQESGRILAALESARRANSMDGHVIIVLRTQEWHLDEYVKDYADWLQGRGAIGPAGWVLYISTADRKFVLVAQDIANDSITPQRREEVALILSEKLERGDMVGAVLDAVGAIGELPAPEAVHERKKFSPDMLVFMGIAIMVIALMMRLRTSKRKSVSAAR
jgi:uncharacterized membrane protein YgcG